MGGPKIVVFHIRQLLRTGAFVLGGLVIICLLIWVLMPKDKTVQTTQAQEEAQATYIPGVYSARVSLNSGDLSVTVTVDRDRITSVGLSGMNESHEALYPLVNPVMQALSNDVLLYQTANVAVPADSPLTGQLLLNAISIALNQAYANVVETGY